LRYAAAGGRTPASSIMRTLQPEKTLRRSMHGKLSHSEKPFAGQKASVRTLTEMIANNKIKFDNTVGK